MKTENFSEAFELAKGLLESLPVQKPGTHFDCLIPPVKRGITEGTIVTFTGFLFGMLIGPVISCVLFSDGIFSLFVSVVVGAVIFSFMFSLLYDLYNDKWEVKHEIETKIYYLYDVLETEEQKEFESMFYKRILAQAQQDRIEAIKDEDYV